MKHYTEALKAKINAGPTAPSIDTRQSRRAEDRAGQPARYTVMHEDGNRAARRKPLLFRVGPHGFPVKPATKKGAPHFKQGESRRITAEEMKVLELRRLIASRIA